MKERGMWNTRDGPERVFAGKGTPAGCPVCKLQAVSVAVVEAGKGSDLVE